MTRKLLLLLAPSLVSVSLTFAQDIPAAPLPTALTSARSVFISNGGEQDNVDCLRAYNEFYAGTAALNRFQIVLDPAQADLILELHYIIQIGRAYGSNGTTGSSAAREFRLALIDPKTHVTLWTVVEAENSALFKSNRDKNLDAAMTALVADLQKLTGPVPTAPDDKAKQRIR